MSEFDDLDVVEFFGVYDELSNWNNLFLLSMN